MGKPKIAPKQLKLTAVKLLRSAETVLLESASRATGFEDAADFKRALLADLEDHASFHKAVNDFHERHAAPAPRRSAPKGGPRTTGRVQASRYDPSLGQKDRRRGKRAAGGKRVGQGKAKR